VGVVTLVQEQVGKKKKIQFEIENLPGGSIVLLDEWQKKENFKVGGEKRNLERGKGEPTFTLFISFRRLVTEQEGKTHRARVDEAPDVESREFRTRTVHADVFPVAHWGAGGGPVVVAVAGDKGGRVDVSTDDSSRKELLLQNRKEWV
jgi:hypothetical protein